MKIIAKLILFAMATFTLAGGVSIFLLQDTDAQANSVQAKDVRANSTPVAAPSTEELQKMALPYLQKAEKDARRAAIARATEFRRFIFSRAGNARNFAEEIMGWRGSWKAAWGYFDPESHKQYLAEVFGKHFFSGYELKSAMRRSISHALKDIEGIENRLASDLRTVVMGRSLAPGEMVEAKRAFHYVMSNAMESSRWELTKTVGKLTATDLIAGATSAAMTHLAASMTVAGLGAAGSAYTIGASIVAAIVVDCLIEWIDDPASDIAKDIRYSLYEIGNKGETSILTEMDAIITQKGGLWDRAAKEALQ